MSLNGSLVPQLEAFVQQTVREARMKWLRGEIRRGLDSGPAEPFEASFWSDLRDELRARGDGSGRD